MHSARVRAFIGVGANLGDASATVRRAIDACRQLPASTFHAASSLYRSAPIDGGGPHYINAVVAIDTSLSPTDLLAQLQRVEAAHGRERSVRNAPRTLDLDLLLYGDLTMHCEALTLPHPRMHLRAFVLLPLAELAPAVVLPGQGPLQQWLERAADQHVELLA